MKSRIAVFAALFALSAVAAAQTLTGTVTNGTTTKPAAHDDVVLIDLMQGMNEAARTKTDAAGRFTLNVGSQGPHLVRVNHQGVNYFRMAPPGTTSVEVQVYDAAKKVEGITGTVNVMRLQSDGSALQGLELYAVKNSSNPPTTLMNDRPFEFYLPPGAQVDQAAAQSPGGNPVNVSAVPAGSDGRYYIIFPIRPGETQFQIGYHMPYSGEATVQPRFTMPYEHVAVVLPKSMQFTPQTAGSFSPMDDNGSPIQVATNVTPGKQLGFRISGTGSLQDQAATQNQPEASANGRMGPGGGLGAPIGSPDPLHQYRWPILGGLGIALLAGGVYVVKRPKSGPSAASASPRVAAEPIRVPNHSANLLEALKEELFQLEVERQQGRISAEEYTKSKEALDQTIKRALARRA